MKFYLVILMLFGLGCASDGPTKPCWKWDWVLPHAHWLIGPIEESEPEGLPENYQTVYIPDNTL